MSSEESASDERRPEFSTFRLQPEVIKVYDSEEEMVRILVAEYKKGNAMWLGETDDVLHSALTLQGRAKRRKGMEDDHTCANYYYTESTLFNFWNGCNIL